MRPVKHTDFEAVKAEHDAACICEEYLKLPRDEQIQVQAETLRRAAELVPHDIGAILLCARANLLDFADVLRPEILILKPWKPPA